MSRQCVLVIMGKFHTFIFTSKHLLDRLRKNTKTKTKNVISECLHGNISLFRSNVTPNAQESEDSGLSLGYSSTDAAKRMSSSSSSINSEQDHDRDIYDDDARELRQHGTTPLDLISTTGNGGHDFRYATKIQIQPNICILISCLYLLWRSMSSQFTRITSIEQRRQYKTEFDKDYAEYMRLHGENERVSRRFAQLEESLRNTEHNDQRYKVSIP